MASSLKLNTMERILFSVIRSKMVTTENSKEGNTKLCNREENLV